MSLKQHQLTTAEKIILCEAELLFREQRLIKAEICDILNKCPFCQLVSIIDKNQGCKIYSVDKSFDILSVCLVRRIKSDKFLMCSE